MTENTENQVPVQRRNIKTPLYLALLAFLIGWIAMLGVMRLRHSTAAGNSGRAERMAPSVAVTNNAEGNGRNTLSRQKNQSFTNPVVMVSSVANPMALAEADSGEIAKQLFQKNIDTLRILTK